jgi:hypothetical protein
LSVSRRVHSVEAVMHFEYAHQFSYIPSGSGRAVVFR